MSHSIRIAAAGAAALLLAACSESGTSTAQNADQPPPPVTVAEPLKKTITEWDEFTGRFEAVEHVSVRARVSGFLEEVRFEDGEIVNEGDLLFRIDPRPFQAAVDEARARINEAQAALDVALSDVDRARPLLQNNTITTREFQSREATSLEARASLVAAQARLRQSQLELEWTEVRAPISGRVSDARVDAGNLIAGGQANATLLTTIVSQDPIHFVFESSEADFLKYSRLSRNGRRPSSRETANPVAVRLADEDEFVHQGVMNFVDNVIDPRSGTMRGRAVFENPTGFLTPGVFGRLRLFGGEAEALLIPDEAIASDQARKIVMTVDEEGTVVPKAVQLGPIVDGLRIIRDGLTNTDRIVINGLQRARPGQKVTPEDGTITVAAEN